MQAQLADACARQDRDTVLDLAEGLGCPSRQVPRGLPKAPGHRSARGVYGARSKGHRSAQRHSPGLSISDVPDTPNLREVLIGLEQLTGPHLATVVRRCPRAAQRVRRDRTRNAPRPAPGSPLLTAAPDTLWSWSCPRSTCCRNGSWRLQPSTSSAPAKLLLLTGCSARY
jgi:hypothetical protein